MLTEVEKKRTAAGTAPSIDANGKIIMPEIRPNTQVRLIRANIVRLAKVDGTINLYYYADNSKEYHANDLNYLEVDEETVEIINKLIQAYPAYMKIRQLSEDNESALAVAYDLWDRGFLMTSAPLAANN